MRTQLPSLAQDALRIEQLFAASNYQGLKSNPPVSILSGNWPVLIAAPHAVEHPRHGGLKKADVFTGTIAAQVAKETGCFAVILSKTMNEDPNHDSGGLFKKALSGIVQTNRIHTIINLHGMAQSHPWDVVIGSNFGRSLGDSPQILERTVAALQSAGLSNCLVDSKELFAASNDHNISVYAWEQLKVPAFQMEINRNFRNPKLSPQKYHHLISGLTSTVNSIVS